MEKQHRQPTTSADIAALLAAGQVERLTVVLAARVSEDDARRTALAFMAELLRGSRADAARVLQKIGMARSMARYHAESTRKRMAKDPVALAYDLAAGHGHLPQWPALADATFADTAETRRSNSTVAECHAIYSQRRYEKLIGVQDAELDSREMAMARMVEDGADTAAMARTANMYRRYASSMEGFKRLTQRHAARLRYRILSAACPNHSQPCDCEMRARTFAETLESRLPWSTLYGQRNALDIEHV